MRARWCVFVLVGPALAHCGDDGAESVAAGDAGSEAATSPIIDAASNADVIVDAGTELGPTEPSFLARSPGKDEDPSLLRAKDGTFHVTWYSNRDGKDRLYIKSSKDGRTWSADRALTELGEPMFYPTLMQSADGRFHLVAWQGSLSDAGKIVGRIAYSSSSDTTTWSAPVFLTDAAALAWAPVIVERTPGQLWVTWASDVTGDKDIYVASSNNGGAAWSAATRLTDGAFNDDLPFLATKADHSLVLAWSRFDVTAKAFEAPFTHPSNELVYATSADGTAWSAPIAITKDEPGKAVPDVLPCLYPSADPSGLSLAWASARTGNGSGDIASIGLSAAPVTAANITHLTNVAGSDYSPRVVPAGPDGLYMMAWVSDRAPLTDGGQNLDIYYRLFR